MRSDLFNAGRVFDGLLALAVSYVGLQSATIPQMIEEATAWVNFLQAFFYVGVGWIILCVIRGPALARVADQQLASWDDHHRIYKVPQLVATERFDVRKGEDQERLICFSDADPNAFVYYTYDLTPKVYKRVTVNVTGMRAGNWTIMARQGENHHNGTKLGPDRLAKLRVRLDPETSPVIVRVYCQSYFLGKSDEQYR